VAEIDEHRNIDLTFVGPALWLSAAVTMCSALERSSNRPGLYVVAHGCRRADGI